MVISKKDFRKKRKMDNRGSKSEFFFNFVKEQRVDGTGYIKLNLIYLRCTLRSLEKGTIKTIKK